MVPTGRNHIVAGGQRVRLEDVQIQNAHLAICVTNMLQAKKKATGQVAYKLWVLLLGLDSNQ